MSRPNSTLAASCRPCTPNQAPGLLWPCRVDPVHHPPPPSLAPYHIFHQPWLFCQRKSEITVSTCAVAFRFFLIHNFQLFGSLNSRCSILQFVPSQIFVLYYLFLKLNLSGWHWLKGSYCSYSFFGEPVGNFRILILSCSLVVPSHLEPLKHLSV